MSELTSQIATFRGHILEQGVLDPEGVHHEFVSGMHGRKLDFDTIPRFEDPDDILGDFSPLYNEWVDVNAAFLRTTFPALPQVIIGVANGTNRLAIDLETRLESYTMGLPSAKDDQNAKKLFLPVRTQNALKYLEPRLAVVVEDVGTTGSNSVQVAIAAREAGARDAVVVTTWKRREQLERLDEAGIEYRAIIDEPLPTFSPEDCVQTGFCSWGWRFIRRGEDASSSVNP